MARTLQMVEHFIGTWRGRGIIVNHQIEYGESLEISPFTTPKGTCYRWESKTWKIPEEKPMHFEVGMMRVIGQQAELMLSHPFGLTEVEVGTFGENSLDLAVHVLGRTPSCLNPNVTNVRRALRVEENALLYSLYLTLVDKPEYLHLQARLDKV